MKEIAIAIGEIAKAITLWFTSAKQRATTKALLTAYRIYKLDKEIKKIRDNGKKTQQDVRKIMLLEKKKWAYWEHFNKFIAIN